MKLSIFTSLLFFRFFNLSSCTTKEDEKSYVRNLFSKIKLQSPDNHAECSISDMLLDNKFDIQLMKENDLKMQYTRFKAFYDLSLYFVSGRLENFPYEKLNFFSFYYYTEFVNRVKGAAKNKTDTRGYVKFKIGFFTENATTLIVPNFKKIYHAFCILQNFEYKKLLMESEQLLKASINFQKKVGSWRDKYIIDLYWFNKTFIEKLYCFSKPYNIDNDEKYCYILFRYLYKKLSRSSLFKLNTFKRIYKKRTYSYALDDVLRWLENSDTQLFYADYFKRIRYISTFFFEIVRLQLSEIKNSKNVKDYKKELNF